MNIFVSFNLNTFKHYELISPIYKDGDQAQATPGFQSKIKGDGSKNNDNMITAHLIY